MSVLTGWIILGILVLLIGGLLCLRIRFDIRGADEVTLKLRILGIKIPLYPKTKKKVRVGKFKKGYPKEKVQKKEKKKTKSDSKAEPSSETEETIPITEKIDTVLSLVKLLTSRFFKHLRLDISKLVIVVGGKDAASCAITYGIVAQSTAYLLDFLDHHLRISKKRKGIIDVRCDFFADSVTFDADISASLTVWQILDIGILLAYNYFKGKDIFHLKKS